MVIRPVIPADYPAYNRMVVDYVPRAAGRTLDVFKSFFLEGARDRCIVCADASGPIAFMEYTFHHFPYAPKPVCYMESLYVSPEHRGKGIARRLVEFLKYTAIGAGWGRIYWVTESYNEAARHLYDDIAGPSTYVRYEIDL